MLFFGSDLCLSRVQPPCPDKDRRKEHGLPTQWRPFINPPPFFPSFPLLFAPCWTHPVAVHSSFDTLYLLACLFLFQDDRDGETGWWRISEGLCAEQLQYLIIIAVVGNYSSLFFSFVLFPSLLPFFPIFPHNLHPCHPKDHLLLTFCITHSPAFSFPYFLRIATKTRLNKGTKIHAPPTGWFSCVIRAMSRPKEGRKKHLGFELNWTENLLGIPLAETEGGRKRRSSGTKRTSTPSLSIARYSPTTPLLPSHVSPAIDQIRPPQQQKSTKTTTAPAILDWTFDNHSNGQTNKPLASFKTF